MMISVMIPVFNRTTYVQQAVASVIAERSRGAELEIAVVDNCSTEPEMMMLFKWMESEGVRVIRSAKNDGPIANWNRCIAEAKREWVHLLHDDDFVQPGFYRTVREAIQSCPLGELSMVVLRASTVDEVGNRLSDVPFFAISGLTKEFAVAQACANLVSNPAVVFNRGMALECGGFGGTFPGYLADWNMWFKLAMQGRVYVSPKNLARYRVHGASGTLNENVFSLVECARLVDLQIGMLPGLTVNHADRYRYTVGFGRHLVGLYRRHGRIKEAWRLAREAVSLDSGLINGVKLTKKLLLG